LSLIWWLAKTSHINIPLIIDAPFSPLDDEHRKSMVINFFTSASKQVIVLTKDDITPNWENHLIMKPHIIKEITIVKNIRERKTEIFDNIFNFKK
jgi:DNA sulfur modification protein DndD